MPKRKKPMNRRPTKKLTPEQLLANVARSRRAQGKPFTEEEWAGYKPVGVNVAEAKRLLAEMLND